MTDVYILDAVRTPFGRYGGALSGVRPDDLAAHVVARAARAHPRPRPGPIDDVHLRRRQRRRRGQPRRRPHGRAARRAADHVPGATVNRLCGSGLEAAIQASRADRGRRRRHRPRRRRRVDEPRALGRCPSPTRPSRPARDAVLDHARLAHGQPARCRRSGRSRSARAPRSSPTVRASAARRRTRSRSQPPAAAAAWDGRRLRRRGRRRAGRRPRRATSPSAPTPASRRSAKLKPAFRADGTVTAGNASPLNDGAAAAAARRRGGRELGREPLARIAARGVVGVEPDVFGIGPVEARATGARSGPGIGWADLDVVELNEAFAAQSLACLGRVARPRPRDRQPARRRDRDRPPARRLRRAASLGTLAHELARRGGGYGLAAICIGVGQGLARGGSRRERRSGPHRPALRAGRAGHAAAARVPGLPEHPAPLAAARTRRPPAAPHRGHRAAARRRSGSVGRQRPDPPATTGSRSASGSSCTDA